MATALPVVCRAAFDEGLRSPQHDCTLQQGIALEGYSPWFVTQAQAHWTTTLAGVTMKAIPYLFKAFAIDAPHAQVRFHRTAMMSRGCPEQPSIFQHQVLNGLIKLPWAVKPMIGLTSDVLPVMGFRKASKSFKRVKKSRRLQAVKT